jgi:tRNA(Ile2) C34 agmatinyltransferase TiaS
MSPRRHRFPLSIVTTSASTYSLWTMATNSTTMCGRLRHEPPHTVDCFSYGLRHTNRPTQWTAFRMAFATNRPTQWTAFRMAFATNRPTQWTAFRMAFATNRPTQLDCFVWRVAVHDPWTIYHAQPHGSNTQISRAQILSKS